MSSPSPSLTPYLTDKTIRVNLAPFDWNLPNSSRIYNKTNSISRAYLHHQRGRLVTRHHNFWQVHTIAKDSIGRYWYNSDALFASKENAYTYGATLLNQLLVGYALMEIKPREFIIHELRRSGHRKRLPF